MRIAKTPNGESIINESHTECTECIKKNLEIIDHCPIDRKKARHTKVSDHFASLFECNKNTKIVRSKADHAEKLNRELPFINFIIKSKESTISKYRSDYARLLHNLVTHNAHSIQEFQDIASEAEMIEGGHNQLLTIESAISARISDAARALLRMFQNALAIKNEISVYQRLYNSQNIKNTKEHEIHRVLMNSAYKFFADFNEKGIRLEIKRTERAFRLDYDLASVILYHILDNARKYAIPHRSIHIDYQESATYFQITFTMVSLWIDPSEKEKIFTEEYSGSEPKRLQLDGTGYGMSICKELASKSGAIIDIDISEQNGTEIFYEGGRYSKKKIIFQLPLTK